jgi:hypothetical protein
MTRRLAIVLCVLCVARAACAQDEAAAAVADCQAHQQRLEELESSYTPPPEASGWVSPGMQAQQFGENDLEHERVLTDRACNYAKALRAKPAAAPAARNAQRPAPFRADERRVAPPAAEPAPQVVAPPPMPPPPPRQVIRRPPPPPPQPSVGGTKARHSQEETPAQPAPQ